MNNYFLPFNVVKIFNKLDAVAVDGKPQAYIRINQKGGKKELIERVFDENTGMEALPNVWIVDTAMFNLFLHQDQEFKKYRDAGLLLKDRIINFGG